MTQLSILIPARNEMFLGATVVDCISHIEADTEILVALDGWETELPEDKRLRVIRFDESIGQRAATNRLAEMSNSKYLMKVDAHCSFDQGFDRKMIEVMQDDWTMVPVMRNLHAFDWVCEKGHRRYQGPSGPCHVCGGETKQEIMWIGKTNPQSTAYLFDTEPHFQYFGSFKHRPEGKGNLTETMSLQGSCFMVTREKYFELDLCSEDFGSWGSQGIEVACKTWLSGGKCICNHKTWYAHMFRTQGGDFGFPYQQSGKKIQEAKHYARNLFFTNSWPKQKHPLSWLIERFAPVPGWHCKEKKIEYHPEVTEKVMEAGREFLKRKTSLFVSKIPSSSHHGDTNLTSSQPIFIWNGQGMASLTMCLSGIVSPFPPQQIFSLSSNNKMFGVDTSGIITNKVIENHIIRNGSNEPGINKSMNGYGGFMDLSEIDPSVTGRTPISFPYPTTIIGEHDFRGYIKKFIGSDFINIEGIGSKHESSNSKISKCLLYYTDNRIDVNLFNKIQEHYSKVNIPIVSVSLKPIDFGYNIVVDLDRGYNTMFRQILVGLEFIGADVVYMAEHDVLVHPTHFDFVPPTKDMFYYDENKWHVDASNGHALFYNHMSTSMLCAYRELLLKHYIARVEKVEKEGFTRRFGFEPGSHKPPRGCDYYTRAAYFAKYPSLDIRHDRNLTQNRWRKDQFRNQKQLYAWTEKTVWDLPGWDKEQLVELFPDAVSKS